MSRLIPTPIVDKNGRSTTVHKKPQGMTPPTAALAGIRPTLGSAGKDRAGEQPVMRETVQIKGGQWLRGDGIIMSRTAYFESVWINNGEGEYHWRKNPVEMTGGELYGYLRLGIDPIEASAFKGMGWTPEELGGNPDLKNSLPGPLRRSKYKSGSMVRNNSEAIEALAEAGVPAMKAVKVIESGLSDHHLPGYGRGLNNSLDINQLVELFEKYKYGTNGASDGTETSRLMDAIVRGHIPFDLIRTNTRLDLSRIEKEANDYKARGRYRELREQMSEEDFLRLSDVAAKKVRSLKPVQDLHRVMSTYGEEVLELDLPMLAEEPRRRYTIDEDGYRYRSGSDENEVFGIEGARYIGDFQKLLDATGDKSLIGNWYAPAIGKPLPSGTEYGFWSNGLLDLREAGASPEYAFDLLYHKRLGVEQAMTVLRDGISITLAEGAL